MKTGNEVIHSHAGIGLSEVIHTNGDVYGAHEKEDIGLRALL